MQGSLQSFGVEQIAPKMTVSEYFVHLEEAIRELGRSHLCESCSWKAFFARSHPPQGEKLGTILFCPIVLLVQFIRPTFGSIYQIRSHKITKATDYVGVIS